MNHRSIDSPWEENELIIPFHDDDSPKFTQEIWHNKIKKIVHCTKKNQANLSIFLQKQFESGNFYWKDGYDIVHKLWTENHSYRQGLGWLLFKNDVLLRATWYKSNSPIHIISKRANTNDYDLATSNCLLIFKFKLIKKKLSYYDPPDCLPDPTMLTTLLNQVFEEM